MKDILQALGRIVGPANVLTSPADTAAYLLDWRKQYSGAALCVARPASTDEVARSVALCAENGVAIVPQGGNTGLCGGSVPTGKRPEVVLSLSRMNRVRALDALNNTITVDAGCVLAAVQDAAARAGRFFPVSLAAEGSCQIGGNLSTNAGGVNVLRYGTAREQVLGLEVVLPDGRVLDALRGLRKDNTGYDVKQLFLGAEGTLGIITAAVLRLYPAPTASATAWLAVRDPEQAVGLLSRLREGLGDRLSAFELISNACLEAVLAYAPATRQPLPGPHDWHVLAEFADSGPAEALRERVERVLAEASEAGALVDAAIAQSVEQARAFWRIRETIPEAQFTNVKHDISVAVSRTPEFIRTAGRALAQAYPDVKPYAFGHVGDGNIHYNVGPERLMKERSGVNRIVYDTVAQLGGSISAEHGIGQLKREELIGQKSPVEIELMRALKQALDPRGIMNPGKVL